MRKDCEDNRKMNNNKHLLNFDYRLLNTGYAILKTKDKLTVHENKWNMLREMRKSVEEGFHGRENQKFTAPQ